MIQARINFTTILKSDATQVPRMNPYSHIIDRQNDAEKSEAIQPLPL